MSALAKAFDVVPGWLYAVVILVLSVLLVSTKLQASAANVAAAGAGQQLSGLVATSSALAASSLEKARVKGTRMADEQAKDVHEFNQATSNPVARVAELERRMREQAASFARASGGCMRAAAGAASGGDARGDTGLREVAGADPLVLDGQAQSELAQLVVSARTNGEKLKTGRKALERCSSVNE